MIESMPVTISKIQKTITVPNEIFGFKVKLQYDTIQKTTHNGQSIVKQMSRIGISGKKYPLTSYDSDVINSLLDAHKEIKRYKTTRAYGSWKSGLDSPVSAELQKLSNKLGAGNSMQLRRMLAGCARKTDANSRLDFAKLIAPNLAKTAIMAFGQDAWRALEILSNMVKNMQVITENDIEPMKRVRSKSNWSEVARGFEGCCNYFLPSNLGKMALDFRMKPYPSKGDAISPILSRQGAVPYWQKDYSTADRHAFNLRIAVAWPPELEFYSKGKPVNEQRIKLDFNTLMNISKIKVVLAELPGSKSLLGRLTEYTRINFFEFESSLRERLGMLVRN